MNKSNYMVYVFYKKPIQKYKYVESKRMKKDMLGDNFPWVSTVVAFFEQTSQCFTHNHLPSAVPPN